MDILVKLKRDDVTKNYSECTGAELYAAVRAERVKESRAKIIPEAWRRINSCWLESTRKSLLWKVAHEVIPVRNRFYLWGKSSRRECILCGQIETVQHAVFTCKVPRYLWNCFKKYFGLNSLTYEEAIGVHVARVVKRQRKFYLLVATEIIYQVWVNRCRVVHGGDCWGKERMRNIVSYYVRTWLGRERLRLGPDRFHRLWQCRGFRLVEGIVKFKLGD